MIQDIEPYQFTNEYTPEEPDKDSYILCYDGKRVLTKADGDMLAYPRFEELPSFKDGSLDSWTYLFSIDNGRFYRVEGAAKDTFSGYEWKSVEMFRGGKPAHMAFAGVTGYQLNRWYESHRFCGRCGQKLVHAKKERMLYCESCHQMEYPKIAPAVIVAVTDQNRLLMTRYADRDYKKYALVAGYAEIGETIEETVRREVMEEVGLKVKNIRYYKNQPWSLTDTLLFGFVAELDGDSRIVLDEEELAFGEWFEREEIPVKANGVSLTNEMIVAFKNHEI